MLAEIRKLNVSPSRLTALVLLAVVAITLLNACGGGGGGGGSMKMIINPIGPPENGSTETLTVRDTGEYQILRFDASKVPEFDTLMPTGRTYTAESSVEDVATAEVDADGLVTVTADNRGTSVITITAEGDEIAASTLARSVSVPSIRQTTVTYWFTVDAPNRAPTVANPIPDQTGIMVGTTFSYVFPENTFNDADDDSLSYTASEQPDVAWLNFTAATRTFSGMPAANTAGSITVTVTAADGNDGSVTDEFTIGINRPPVAVGTIAALTFTLRDSAATRDVASNFSDPDNDSLTFTASTSASAIATASVSGSVVTVTPVTVGSATITVTARDPDGLSATQTIAVTVVAADPEAPANQAPTAVGAVAALSFTLGDSTATRDVESNFSDPDSDSLTYTASTSASAIATASVSGSVVTVTPVTVGSATITVTAQDPGGLSVTQNFAVTVNPVLVPDLSVSLSSVTPSQVVTREDITLEATVENVGTGIAARTTLRYYQSSDLTIDSNDIEVDRSTVDSLPPSEYSEESDSFRAPNLAGTYYYYVCVDSVPGETDMSNNCSTIGDGVTVLGPDLIISSSRVSESRVVGGDSFILYATVRNQGAGDADSTTLRYYRSSDSIIDSSNDTEEDITDTVHSLDYRETDDEDTDITAPSSTGTYYYGACVDPVPGEMDTTNNCSDAIMVTVYNGPDLVVSDRTVSDSAFSVGETFTLSATVRNRGAETADSTTLTYYRSSDVRISSSTKVGSSPVHSLAASATSSASIDLPAPSSAGAYYYYACVGSVPREINTNNNCSTPIMVIVVGGPDLIISSLSISGKTPIPGSEGKIYTLTPGESFTLMATVYNQGTGESSSTNLRYYFFIGTQFVLNSPIATDGVNSLDPDETDDEDIDITAPSSPGSYSYGVAVDSVTGESDTTNNTLAIAVIVSAPAPAPAPDLRVTDVGVSDLCLVVGANDFVIVRGTVTNEGSGTASSTTLRYYFSPDRSFTDNDNIQVYAHNVPSLGTSSPSNQHIRENIYIYDGQPLIFSSGAAYYFGACVDNVSGETDTSNNCSTREIRLTFNITNDCGP